MIVRLTTTFFLATFCLLSFAFANDRLCMHDIRIRLIGRVGTEIEPFEDGVVE